MKEFTQDQINTVILEMGKLTPEELKKLGSCMLKIYFREHPTETNIPDMWEYELTYEQRMEALEECRK